LVRSTNAFTNTHTRTHTQSLAPAHTHLLSSLNEDTPKTSFAFNNFQGQIMAMEFPKGKLCGI